jgi:Ni,Fe-hydrogenase III large subunit
MPPLLDLMLEGRPAKNHRPHPRAIIDAELWSFAADQVADGHWALLALWADGHAAVHMALLDEQAGKVGVVSLDCIEGRYPSVAQKHPPALRLERAICDLFGLQADGLPDTRPWLDHGCWGVTHPLGAARNVQPRAGDYEFLPAEGESLHQIPVGPVHAGIIEPGHFRFTANGEAVVRLEERLGYVHKGVEGLMIGADINRGAQLAGRVSGDSTVAYAYAFSQAVEAAWEITAPPRALYIRALLAELERLANHLGDIGAICNDAAFALMHAHCAILRERVLRAAEACFHHRLMRDCIVPGGVASDLTDDGSRTLRQLVDDIRRHFPKLVELYDNTASLQDRTVNTGAVSSTLVRQYSAGGYIGRASGRPFDARRAFGYSPYDALSFDVPVLQEGDVNARVWIRIREVEQSLSLLEQILSALPTGSRRADLTNAAGIREGLSIVEGFRGDILVWLRLDDAGKIARCHMRDPSWFQWPLLEAAIKDNIVADFPLCNKSFNCSYSGHDL